MNRAFSRYRVLLASVLALGLLGQPWPAGAEQDAKAETSEARGEYERLRIWLDPHGQPFRGSYGIPLRGERFYQETGRPDLADKYRARSRTRLGLMLGGAALMTVSLVGMGVAAAEANQEWQAVDKTPCGPNWPVYTPGGGYDDPPHCRWGVTDSPAFRLGLYLAVPAFVTGLGLLIAGGVYHSHPVERSETLELVDQHNRQLRTKLRLGSYLRDNLQVMTAGAGGLHLALKF